MSSFDRKRAAEASRRRRRRIVTVIGSGDVVDPLSEEIGRRVAALGFDLLTGGGRGVMEAVSRAFSLTSPRKGLVLAVVPAAVDGMAALETRSDAAVDYVLPDGYPNEWVELAIYTHLPDSGDKGTLRSSRNHINVLTADAIVALPGGSGTESEMWLATKYGIPIVAIGSHSRVPPGIPLVASVDDVAGFLISAIS